MLLYSNAALFQCCFIIMLLYNNAAFSCLLQKLRPWNMMTAKHESCLCKSCENFGCYEKGLAKAMELLVDAYKGTELTDDGVEGP